MTQADTDERFMREALKEARKAFDAGEVPVGAVLVSRGKVIGRGSNQVEALRDATAHAEMLAITAGNHHLGAKYLAGCTLYVTLEPCGMCAGAMNWSQLSRLVYGAPDEQRGYRTLKGSVLHSKTRVRAGVLAAESTALLEAFFRRIRD